MHRITQHADSGDGNLDGIFCEERADAGRGAGGNDVAGEQGHHAGDPADEERAGIDHERGAAGLAEFVVDAGFDDDVRGVEFGFDVRADGAKSVEAFGAGELDVGFLEVARGDVVGAGVAEDVGERIFGVGRDENKFCR